MTDLEMTRLCAEAVGYKVVLASGSVPDGVLTEGGIFFRPLVDDNQAMELVKKLRLSICCDDGTVETHRLEVFDQGGIGTFGTSTFSPDPNRAICEHVAKVQLAKSKEPKYV